VTHLCFWALSILLDAAACKPVSIAESFARGNLLADATIKRK
jgi:hypothetical protein